MTDVQVYHLQREDWQPHPTLPGIDVRQRFTEGDHLPRDVMVARVQPGERIPRHVHPDETEVAYVVAGQGVVHMSSGADDAERSADLDTGTAFIVPPGVHHAVDNTGDGVLVVFALHVRVPSAEG